MANVIQCILQKWCPEAARVHHLESDQKVAYMYMHLLVLQPVLALAQQAWLPKNLGNYRDQRSIVRLLVATLHVGMTGKQDGGYTQLT